MKAIIEIDLAKVESVDDLWRVLPETLSEVAVDIANAGNVGGDVYARRGSHRDGSVVTVGSWVLE